MRKHQVNILLLKVIKRFALRQNTPNQFVGYFDAAFLIRGTGIAIENKTAKLIVFILFDGDRIAELTATVSQNDRKESTIGWTSCSDKNENSRIKFRFWSSYFSVCDETYTCVCTSKCNTEICKTKCNGGVAFTFANEFACFS